MSDAAPNTHVPLASAPHIPVMATEVAAHLAVRADGVYVDGTFGAGGYSRTILAAGAGGVIGIDRDPSAIAAGRAAAAASDGRLRLVEGCFGDMESLLATAGIAAADGIALDLGVSSMQLDRPERGFSFAHDGPLDMRMGNHGTSAADLVNTAEQQTLADILWRFGEERHARRIARAICAARVDAPIVRTGELAALVARAVPRPDPHHHPATRTFQALRIAVNDELGELERGLAASQRLLKPGGRCVVVAFHSLEDRIVKDFFRERSGAAPRGSRHLPADPAAERPPAWRTLTRRPAVPSAAEVAANPRARSARLRAAERLSDSGLQEGRP